MKHPFGAWLKERRSLNIFNTARPNTMEGVANGTLIIRDKSRLYLNAKIYDLVERNQK